MLAGDDDAVGAWELALEGTTELVAEGATELVLGEPPELVLGGALELVLGGNDDAEAWGLVLEAAPEDVLDDDGAAADEDVALADVIDADEAGAAELVAGVEEVDVTVQDDDFDWFMHVGKAPIVLLQVL